MSATHWLVRKLSTIVLTTFFLPSHYKSKPHLSSAAHSPASGLLSYFNNKTLTQQRFIPPRTSIRHRTNTVKICLLLFGYLSSMNTNRSWNYLQNFWSRLLNQWSKTFRAVVDTCMFHMQDNLILVADSYWKQIVIQGANAYSEPKCWFFFITVCAADRTLPLLSRLDLCAAPISQTFFWWTYHGWGGKKLLSSRSL